MWKDPNYLTIHYMTFLLDVVGNMRISSVFLDFQ